jgi:hypothetical protein
MRGDRRRPVGARAALATLAGVLACGGPRESRGAAPGEDRWREYAGTWTATGDRHTLLLESDHRAAIIEVAGSLLLESPSGPAMGFLAEAIALSDTRTGLVGRAVWTDERGDRIFSDLTGASVATGNRIGGVITGGTSRYARAEGTYEFSWQYVIEAEEGAISGRTVGLRGRLRAVQPHESNP